MERTARRPRVLWRVPWKQPLVQRTLCPRPCRSMRRDSGAERSADSRLGFLRPAVLIAAVNLAPAVMAVVTCWENLVAAQAQLPRRASARETPER